MPNPLHLTASLVLGMCLALQPPINAVMARTLGSTLMATTLSIAISLALALGAWGIWGKGAADLVEVPSLPWWVVVGGVIGAVFVAVSMVLAPAMGVALFFVCVVAGQLVASAALDHVGAFGMPVQPVSAAKLAGLALVLVGAALVQGSRA